MEFVYDSVSVVSGVIELMKPCNSSTGAGDTFTAGMLFGLLCRQDDWPLERKLRFANELAGRKVAQEGFAGLGGLVEGCLKD